jgi:hypothetical protein
MYLEELAFRRAMASGSGEQPRSALAGAGNSAAARSEARFAKITDLGNRQDVAKWHQLTKDRIDSAERMSRQMDLKGPGSKLIRENLENQIRTLRSELQESQALLNHK